MPFRFSQKVVSPRERELPPIKKVLVYETNQQDRKKNVSTMMLKAIFFSVS